MPHGPRVNGAATGAFYVLRNVRPYDHLPRCGHEVARILSLVGAYTHRAATPALPSIAPLSMQHQQCRVAFGSPVGLRH
jgi:hypothetical protein